MQNTRIEKETERKNLVFPLARARSQRVIHLETSFSDFQIIIRDFIEMPTDKFCILNSSLSKLVHLSAHFLEKTLFSNRLRPHYLSKHPVRIRVTQVASFIPVTCQAECIREVSPRQNNQVLS